MGAIAYIIARASTAYYTQTCLHAAYLCFAFLLNLGEVMYVQQLLKDMLQDMQTHRHR